MLYNLDVQSSWQAKYFEHGPMVVAFGVLCVAGAVSRDFWTCQTWLVQ